jgi:uncharacterized protein
MQSDGGEDVFELGRVATLRRYPVKSMLGEDIIESDITTSGLVGDRVVALVDVETGHVATAKHPKAWRYLLGFGARWSDGTIQITTPGGVTVSVEDRDVDQALSDLLHRPVHLSHVRPERAAVARPAPEDVIAEGEDADVPYEMLEIGHGTPGSTFVDYAAVHIITSTTLAEIGAEMVRYRPNIVLSTPGSTPFSENDWPGREIVIGEVRLRVLIPTPRCAVPTLAHGELPRRTDAVQRVLNANRINVPGFGVLPCLGAYAEVVNGGTIALGDVASLGEEV